MKREGQDLPYIELHFLKKDMDTSMIDKNPLLSVANYIITTGLTALALR